MESKELLRKIKKEPITKGYLYREVE